MRLAATLITISLVAGLSHALLVCHHCDDCTMNLSTVELCGTDSPNIPEVPTAAPPLPDTTTTTVLPPGTTPDGDPILTPPTLPTHFPPTMGTSGLPDLATPPITPKSSDVGGDSRLVLPMEPSDRPRFGCMMVRTNVQGREVVRRGCVNLMSNNEETCNYATGGQHLRCSVCITHFCNTGL